MVSLSTCTLVCTVVVAGTVVLARPAASCNVGDPGGPPQLVITASPPDCCYGAQAGTIAGTVSNVNTEQAVVVIYALTDVYYVQPVVGARVIPSCGGVWSTSTHGGTSYAAILARPRWSPPEMLTQLPAVGGDILAVVRAPESQRRLQFAGRTWLVKSSGSVPFGPGPNVWSDAPENVWVDAEGLHLRLVERDGQWTCSEVMSEAFIGHGRLRFQVDGGVDAMDPNVVFAGFFYADGGAEADIEWSRWGDASSPTNGQYAVQPDAVQPWSLALGGAGSTHQIDWRSGSIDFASWAGVARADAPPLASWSHAGAVASSEFERMHFNLWFLDGMTPAAPVEVIVRSFESDVPSAAAEGPFATEGPRLLVPTIVRGSLAYTLELPEATPVTLRLFDPRGRMVQEVERTHLPAGIHRGLWSAAASSIPLAQGFYFLRLEAGNASSTARVLLLR